jgi:tricorn protease
VLEGVVELVHSTGGEIRDLAWSPDSRFLAWAQPTNEFASLLFLADTDQAEPEPTAVTSGAFLETSPAFTADGKYLAFVSARTFETAYDDLVFDLSFINAQRPHLVPLARTTADPFGPEPDGWSAGDPDQKKDDEKKADDSAPAEGEHTPSPASAAGAADAKKPPSTEVDLEAIEARTVPFPVPSGHMTHLRAVKTGLVWLRHPQDGVLGSTRAGVEGDAPGPVLEHWNLQDRKVQTLVEGVSQLWVSGNGEQLVVRQGEDLVQIPSDHKVEPDDPARITIDLKRLVLRVDPVLERRGMLWDNYRIMAQQYWRPDMDGQDWHAMTSWYDETVERLVTTDDFNDMMWEVVGELGTSHAYVMPPASPAESESAPGKLGANTRREGDRILLDRILAGDSSDPGARSPLLAPGVDAQVGDAIVAIGGRRVYAADGVEPLLIGTANTPTELVLERGGDQRRVVVTPLVDDAQLRYQDWVASRRAFVAEHGQGRLGYLHIPDMVSDGWAQMHRDLREASAREGLVVDVRYNSGGHTSQLVTDRLARKVVSWGYARGEEPNTYPEFAPRGPVVFVTNQEAGSDGDIVNAVAKAMDIGPVIGTRTWGGVIGIDGRFDLVDGTGVTEPKYASWFQGVDWTIENYGVDPDIEVPFPPNLWIAGADPQLARGVEEALARLERKPAAVAPPLPPKRFGN